MPGRSLADVMVLAPGTAEVAGPGAAGESVGTGVEMNEFAARPVPGEGLAG